MYGKKLFIRGSRCRSLGGKLETLQFLRLWWTNVRLSARPVSYIFRFIITLLFIHSRMQATVLSVFVEKKKSLPFQRTIAAPIFSLPCAWSSVRFLQRRCPLEEVWRCKAKSKGQRSIKLNKTLADRAGHTRPRRDSSGRIQFAPTQPRHVSLCKCCWEQLKHSSCVIGQISCQDVFFCSRRPRVCPDCILL